MVSGACGLKTMVSSAFCRKLQGNLLAGKPSKADQNRINFLVDPGVTFAPGAGGNVIQKRFVEPARPCCFPVLKPRFL